MRVLLRTVSLAWFTVLKELVEKREEKRSETKIERKGDKRAP